MAQIRNRIRHCIQLAWLLVLLVCAQCAVANEPPTAEQVVFFEKSVRPLLIDQCYKCHSGRTAKGGLRVDSRGQLLLGGESGPAIEPGRPDDSALMAAVRYESYEMPPSKKLDDDQIAILARWIEMGAPWPGDDGQVARRPAAGQFSDEDRRWWSLQPVSDPTPPTDLNHPEWCRNPIDQFIAAQQDMQQLAPAPEADRSALIRRVYFDLIGLPPTPDEIRNFEQDPSPEAYEHLVDELLARPEYGERWGRHWLDLVRYAESDGYRADNFRPQAWMYRDYVIRSLNDDKPYDRFVQEQLAADELFPDDPSAIAALGYLRNGIFEYNVPDVQGQWDNVLNEVTDVTGDVFFGLGFQCARCHDHKFDPLLQKDYFRLRAFFEPMLPRDDVAAATREEQERYAAQEAAYQEKSRDLLDQLNALLKKPLDDVFEDTIKRYPDDLKRIIRQSPAERSAREEQWAQFALRLVKYEQDRVDGRLQGETKDQVLALRRELAKLDPLKPAPLLRPMSVTDVGTAPPRTIIPKRNIEVQAGFPTILEPDDATIAPPENRPNSTGRRAALARWLIRPDNPLSTRVIVNRVWQSHFGRGLAANGSDFGTLGGLPSHPQLLDWLTSRFVEKGWRLKSLHRLIVTSATYRQSAQHPRLAELQLQDPTNRWYWRGDVRRLDAEQIRDSIFAVTGQLEISRGGLSVLPDRPRRSIYTRVMRNSRDPLLEVFDLPQFISSSSGRNTTTSPIQSLLLINNQTMLKHAEHLAEKICKGSGEKTLTARIDELWWAVLGRVPSVEEREQAQASVIRQMQIRTGNLETEGLPSGVITGKVPGRDGQALLFQAKENSERFLISNDARLSVDDFTVEAFFQIRSVYDSGEVRTLASKLTPNRMGSGWLLGITGKTSRRKPQTLVLQLFGKDADGKSQEALFFSDHHLELNKPYYAAASVHLARPGEPGNVTFFVKDLSNDDEPLLTITSALTLVSLDGNDAPLALGSRGESGGYFDGLLDDVRLSNDALAAGQLLISSDGIMPSTIGYWQFEPNPGLFQNSLPQGLPIRPGRQVQQSSPADAAFVDLCHVLLNSNEFLYVK
ncbi:DUF1549 domain-containing protein [Planctomicrobium piriforme]|uniref:Planctomycete cytochrome C n=1 Tax=Planctomicrobium piriforme TaxID=1576369 RepID=A0A1I3RVA0_9PLAN|nr:DUF1549 domain-containing protein [Planctomicrobium piriforme]SFJ50514.1 Planctomycete cytochrome C [Planctomicrobium piriforme]